MKRLKSLWFRLFGKSQVKTDTVPRIVLLYTVKRNNQLKQVFNDTVAYWDIPVA